MAVTSAMVVVAAAEIAIHWLFGRHESLLAIYLMTDFPSGKHSVALVLDSVAPGAIVGFVNGWVGFPRRSILALAATAVGLSLFVAGLMPIYGLLVGMHHYSLVWGAPTSVSGNIWNVLFAFFAAGGCTYGGYANRRHWENRKR